MKKFEISFQLNNSGLYLAPQLLPVDSISFDISSYGKEITNYEFRYNFMPKGILTRFIVRNHELIFKKNYWRYGVVLYYEGSYALVQEKFFDRKILIQIAGSNKRDLLTIIRKSITEINGHFSDLEYEEMIPCNCTHCITLKIPYFHRAEDLRFRLNNNVFEVDCNKSLIKLNIHYLLGDIIPSEADPRGQVIYNFYNTVTITKSSLGDKNIIQNKR